jgi:hypothetical protein
LGWRHSTEPTHYTNHEYGLRSVRSANSIEAVPQRKLKNDYGAAEGGNGGSVSWRVEQTEAHPNPAIRLHPCGVRDGCDVVVVEPMAKPNDGHRSERELKIIRCGGHECLSGQIRNVYPSSSSRESENIPGLRCVCVTMFFD